MEGLVALVIATFAASPCGAARAPQPDSAPLLKLASSKFPNLTHAERALLEFADKSNLDRGEFAIAGTSSAPLDPSNDPARAGEWSHDRDVRAELIRWLAIDDSASAHVDPGGFHLLGARIVGPINLSHVRVPFSLVMRRCAIGDRIVLTATELPHLNLNGSYIAEIDGKGLIVHSDLDLADGFHAAGEVRLENTKLDGDLNCGGGSFHYSASSLSQFAGPFKPALIADDSTIGGEMNLGFGFRAEGAILVRTASVAGSLDLGGARLSNPNNSAFRGVGSSFGAVFVAPPKFLNFGNFEANGVVDFTNSRTKGFLFLQGRFQGAAGDGHGLVAAAMTVDGPLVLQNLNLENGAILDLSGAHATFLIDDEKSWPAPGRLLIGSFTYEGLGAPSDARSRLRWLGLQPGFNPQPYRQLAKVLREAGDDSGAVSVLIAGADKRYQQYGLPGRLLGWLLKVTIGYGHRPLLALLWSLGVVLVGWGVVYVGKRTHVMRLTWPETTPPPAGNPIAGLNPLLYSLDVFVPFVNLHQEHYWWPDESISGNFKVAGLEFSVRGSTLRAYLWLQIIAGWLLSAIFIAGVTGLLRND